MKRTTVGILAMISCFLWASVFPTLKTLYSLVDLSNGVSSLIALAGMRFFAAGVIILAVYTIINRKLPVLAKENHLKVGLIGLFQTAGLYAALYISTNMVTGVKASVLSQSGIFIVTILAFFVLHEHINKNQWMGLLLGLAGILAINVTGLTEAGEWFEFSLFGEGLLLLSGLFGAIGTILVKLYGKGIPAMILTGWQMAFGGFVLCVIGFSLNGGWIVLPSVFAWLLFLHTIVVASVGFTLWYTLLQHVKVSDIISYRLSIPILGSVISALILPDEHLTLSVVVGIICVAYGIYLSNKTLKTDESIKQKI